ncbi:hypothetical protein, partial [Priestia megaterium]|uniref:hypothetical protein n=1 Tax=Priestia megaterium TaxID=1404 RepID=UPI001C98E8B7
IGNGGMCGGKCGKIREGKDAGMKGGMMFGIIGGGRCGGVKRGGREGISGGRIRVEINEI